MPSKFAYEIEPGKVVPIPGTICGAWGEQTLSIVEAAGSRKQFSGKAYSGGPLRLKEYPHPVVVDLAGLAVPAQKLPTPKDHDLRNLVGETSSITIHALDGISIAGNLDASTPDGQLIAAAAKGGLDWELSIGAPVHEIEEVRAGESVTGFATAIRIGAFAIGGLTSTFGGLWQVVTTGLSLLSPLLAVAGALLSPIGLLAAAVTALATASISSSGAWQSLVGWLQSGIGGIVSWITEQFGVISAGWGGIVDAIASGDLALAGQIAMTALSALWNNVVAAIRQTWAGFKNWFQETTGISFSGVVAAFKTAWAEAFAFIRSVWAVLLNSLINTEAKWGQGFSNWLLRRFGRMMGLSEDVIEITITQGNAELRNQVSRRDAELDRLLNSIERGRGAERRRIEDDRMYADFLDAAGDDAGAADARQSAADAMWELEAQLDLAHRQRQARRERATNETGRGLDDFMRDGGGAMGTFNVYAAGGLAVSSPVVRILGQVHQEAGRCRRGERPSSRRAGGAPKAAPVGGRGLPSLRRPGRRLMGLRDAY